METNSENIENFDYNHSRSMRIALVTETFAPEINGVAMTFGKITEALLGKSHSLQIVRPRQSPQDTPIQNKQQQDILVGGFPIPFYKELKFGFPSEGLLIKHWKQDRPDVVHVATEGPLGLSAINAARKLNLPVTSSFHTNFQNYTNHYGLGLLQKPIDIYLRWLHNLTMATLAPTQSMVNALNDRGYKNVSLFSRGVAIEHFSPTHRSHELRKTWGIGEKDIVVVYVGRLAKEKNVNLVIRTFAAIQSKHPEAKLVFVGDGPLRKSLQQNLPNAVFSGMKTGSELATHYASGDLFLFASETETFGNVVPEALASGLAVVAYNYAAAAQLISNEQNGWLVPLGDEQCFVKTALAAAANTQLMQSIRAHAAPSVANLDWGVVSDRFISTLHHIVDQHSRQNGTTKINVRMEPVIQPSA